MTPRRLPRWLRLLRVAHRRFSPYQGPEARLEAQLW